MSIHLYIIYIDCLTSWEMLSGKILSESWSFPPLSCLKNIDSRFQISKNIFPLLHSKYYCFSLFPWSCYESDTRCMWIVQIFGRYNVTIKIETNQETHFSVFSPIYETFWPTIINIELHSFMLNFTKDYQVHDYVQKESL